MFMQALFQIINIAFIILIIAFLVIAIKCMKQIQITTKKIPNSEI